MSVLRKQGECKECGQPLYGDDYGPGGHKCPKAMPPFRAWVAVHEGTRPYEGGFSTIDAEDAKWGFLNDPNVYWSSWELAEANGWRVVCVEVREVEK